ncbi:MAG: hypothetical protein V1859_10825 [archaeon]
MITDVNEYLKTGSIDFCVLNHTIFGGCDKRTAAKRLQDILEEAFDAQFLLTTCPDRLCLYKKTNDAPGYDILVLRIDIVNVFDSGDGTGYNSAYGVYGRAITYHGFPISSDLLVSRIKRALVGNHLQQYFWNHLRTFYEKVEITE